MLGFQRLPIIQETMMAKLLDLMCLQLDGVPRSPYFATLCPQRCAWDKNLEQRMVIAWVITINMKHSCAKPSAHCTSCCKPSYIAATASAAV